MAITKIYKGTNDVTSQFLKIYRGLTEVWKAGPSFGDKTVLSNLDYAKYVLAGAGANNYAVFAGGFSNENLSTVEAYNMASSGSKIFLSNLTTARNSLSGVSTGNYVVFAGGVGYSTLVETYNMLSSGSKSTFWLSVGRYSMGAAGTSTGRAVFAGGSIQGSPYKTSIVESFNISGSGTRSTLTALAYAVEALAGAGVGQYAVFAGGTGPTTSDRVERYSPSTSSSKTALPDLDNTKYSLAGAGANGYAVFAGGLKSNYYSAPVEAYAMSNGAKTTLTAFYVGSHVHRLSSTSINNYVVFAGGTRSKYDSIGSSVSISKVCAYNMGSGGTITTLPDLDFGKCELAGAGANNYAVFAGGTDGSQKSKAVEAYYLGT